MNGFQVIRGTLCCIHLIVYDQVWQFGKYLFRLRRDFMSWKILFKNHVSTKKDEQQQ